MRNTALAACLLVFALIGLFVQFAVRLDYGPDEPDHMEYIHVLAWDHRLPTPDETHIVQHPPVYYAAMATLWRAGGAAQDPASLSRGPQAISQMTPQAVLGRRLLRFASTLLGCLTLLILARILSTVGVPKPWQIVVILLAAAIPMFQYVSALVNNENFSILYSSLVCLAIVRRVRSGECTARQALGLGLLVGGGALIKQTTLFAVPLALWTVWVLGSRSGRWTRSGLFLAGLPALGLWWPLHNRLAVGQWFPCYTIPAQQARVAAHALSHPLILLSWIRTVLETSFLPEWAMAFIPGMILTSVIVVFLGMVIGLFLAGLRARQDLTLLRLRGLAVAAMLLLLAGIIQFCLADDFRAELGGRYLLNGLPWLVTLLGASAPLLGKRLQQGPPLGAILPLVLLGLFDAGWWYVVQGYYANPNFGH